jgi:lipid-binding SYLF domain-containing protein
MKVLTIFFSILIFISSNPAQSRKDLKTAETRAAKSVAVIKQFAALGADSLPVEYLQTAKAVIVFPGLTRVNILLSELVIGNGIVALRSADGNWSVPAFLAFKGTDTNLRIAGKKSFDTVFLLMDDKVVERLKKGDMGFSSDDRQRVLLGPVIKGDGAEETMERANIIYYTFDNGQLVDANLSDDTFFKSFAILHDNNMNKAIFSLKTKLLFAAPETSLKIPGEIEKFRTTLTVAASKTVAPESDTSETIKNRRTLFQ